MADVHNVVNWFEIPVADLARARSFYESVLDVELSLNEMGAWKMAWFPLHGGAPGSTGALVLADGYVPSTAGSLVYFSVACIEDALEKIRKGGGSVLMAKQSIGEYGHIAHFEDTEGNRVALHAPA